MNPEGILRTASMRMLARPRLWRPRLAALGGCQTFGDVTGSISAGAGGGERRRSFAPTPRAANDVTRRNPGEKSASIAYARALRALTRYKEARRSCRQRQ